MSKKAWIVTGVVVLLAGAGTFVLIKENRGAEQKFRKEKVERGDVVAMVTATGVLSAVTTVKVGSQASGIIAKLHVDFNSEVKKGQLLAELDPTPFQATVEQRRADTERTRVELRNAEISFVRAKSLFQQQLLSKAEYDLAQANRDSAAAAVRQSEAQLKQAQTNLGYAKITSPIDGVVVDRQYDVGQTVAASFQAPVLFTIAQDLTKMQVLTNIDEADIGRVRVGQGAVFNVDAFPERPFRGAVSQIRLSPQTVQNVVTYPVLLDVQNPEGRLKPGMTANVQVPVDERRNTLRVPNAALRFRPPEEALVDEAKSKDDDKGKEAKGASKSAEERPTPIATAEAPRAAAPQAAAPDAAPPGTLSGGGREGREGGRGAWSGGGAGRGNRGDRAGRGAAAPGGGAAGGGEGRPRWSGGEHGMGGGGGRGGSRTGTVYLEVADTGKLKPIKLKTSITDGNYTAVESEDLKEGDDVVVGFATVKAMDSGGRAFGGGGPGGPGGGGGRPAGGGGRRGM